MATSGREWAELIAFNNSGTYCNQYMVIDLKLFTSGEELQPDLLWVIEQVHHLPDRITQNHRGFHVAAAR